MPKILLVLALLGLAACGGTKTSTNATASTDSPTTAETENTGEVQHQMPDGDQLEEAYNAILEKANVDDPELMEVYISFGKSIADPNSDRAHISLQLVSPANKNKLVSYHYDFQGKQVEGPQEVTLTTGIGSSEKFIDTYDGFKASLFKKSDILDFDKADEVYRKAVAKSEYAPKDCYVDGLQFRYFPSGLRGSVAVQSTRSTSAHKSFYIDKAGTILAY